MAIMSPEETARKYAANRAKNPRYNPNDPTSGVDPAALPMSPAVNAENLRPDQTLEGLQRANMNRMAGVSQPVQQTAVPVEQPLGASGESAANTRATQLSNAMFLRRAQDNLHKQLVNPQFYGVNPADIRQQMQRNSDQLSDINRTSGERGAPLQGADKASFIAAGKEATNLLNPEGQQPSTPNADLFARAKAVQATFTVKRQQAALGLGDNTMAEYRGLTTPPANLDPATRNEQVQSEQHAQRLARLKRLEAAGVQLTPDETQQIPIPDQGPSPQDRADGVAAFTGEMKDINNRRTLTPEMIRDRQITSRARELSGLAQSENANTRVETSRKNEAEMLAAQYALQVAKVKGATTQALQAGQPSPEVIAAQNERAASEARVGASGANSIEEYNQGVLALGGPNIGDAKVKSASDTINAEGGLVSGKTWTNFTALRGIMSELRGKDPAQRRAAARAITRGINPESRQRISQNGDDDEGKKILAELDQYAANG